MLEEERLTVTVADNDYTDPFAITRAERLKKLYKDEAKSESPLDPASRKRRAILETEYVREQPDTPIRGPRSD